MCNLKSNIVVHKQKAEVPRTMFFHGVNGAVTVNPSPASKPFSDAEAERFKAEASEIKHDTSYAKRNGFAGRVFCK